MKSNLRLSLALAFASIGGGFPVSEPKRPTDRDRRTPQDVQSRQDKNAAKRARRAARYAK